MIVQPEVAIAVLRALGERDLALVALVAGMRDSEEEAIERLVALEEVMREYRKTLRRHGVTRKQWEIADGVIEMAPRIASAIRQVQSAGASV